jgi:hypothetical protein
MHSRLLVVAAAALIVLAGCRAEAPSDPSPTASGATQASLLDLARCMRANGYPDFPDPVQDAAGAWILPESSEEAAAADPPACHDMLNTAKQQIVPSEITPEEMAQQQAFARCMREHGLPDFPDPDADGNFPLTDEQRAHELDGTYQQAEQACRHLARPKDPNKG